MKRARGFTLIELLAATALFALLGTLLFQVVRGALDVWATGERNRELNDRATAALDVIAEDLRAVWPGLPGAAEQDSRFLIEALEQDRDGAGRAERRFPVLRFARVCHEQRALDWLRRAGDRAGAEAVADLSERHDPLALQPTGGLAESLYMLAQLPGRELPSLVRRVRSPLGGTDSLLAEDLLSRPERLLAGAAPIADRVLWFGVSAWGPDTTTWERSAGDGPDARVAPDRWDSTRGMSTDGSLPFPGAVGPASLHDGNDDMFPRYVRLVLVLERDESAATSGVLAQALSPDDRKLTVASANFLRDEQAPDHVLVDGEWLEVVSVEGRELSVVRGARGSAPAQHASGARVRFGRTTARVVELPCARENWNP